jgi:CubicO group peptidase (beta-lactamase class C family)
MTLILNFSSTAFALTLLFNFCLGFPNPGLSKPTLTKTPNSILLSNAEKIAKIDELVKYFRVINQIPGFGLTVVQNYNDTARQDLVMAEGYGLRDRELQLEANNKTLFSIGSNLKGFSATLFIKFLHEKFESLGESVMDTPIIKLAPEFGFVLSDRFRTESVTFRDILAMRVCVMASGGFNEVFGSSPDKNDFFYRLRYYPQSCSFRNDFAYSNALYGIAGEIIAHMSNSTVEEVVTNYLRELGMNDSTFFDNDGRYETLPNIAKAYYKRQFDIRPFDNKMLRKVSGVLTAGALLTTPEDMVRYLNLHLNKGRIGDRQIISEKIMPWLYKNSNPMSTGNQLLGKKKDGDLVEGYYGYAFGYMLGLHDGYATVTHGGFYPPYNSRMTLIPELNIGIFTVSNGPGPTGMETGFTQEKLHARIYDILRGSQKPDMEMEDVDTEVSKDVLVAEVRNSMPWIGQDQEASFYIQSKKSPEVQLSEPEIIGLFGNADTGDIIIESDTNEGLQLHFGPFATGRLERQNDTNSWTVQWTSTIMQQFYIYGELVVFDFNVHFPNENELSFELGTNLDDKSFFLNFKRNATVDTFPVIPWDEDSCGPTL